jgi:hypothetical protein
MILNMKKQNNFLRGTSIVFILLGTLLCWTGCKQGNAQENTHQSVTKNATFHPAQTGKRQVTQVLYNS